MLLGWSWGLGGEIDSSAGARVEGGGPFYGVRNDLKGIQIQGLPS